MTRPLSKHCRIIRADPACRSRIRHGLDGKTPAEAAGIIIRGHDKWLAPFQNAAVAA